MSRLPKLPKFPQLPTGWPWTLLSVAAIVFASLISGSWLGSQMEPALPRALGIFGTALAGFAVFGGVELAIYANGWRDGQRWIGTVLILAGVAAEVTFDHQFFASQEHGTWTAIVLAAFPSVIAVMSGIVKTSSTRRHKREVVEEQERSLDLRKRAALDELEIQAARERMAQELEQQRLDAQAVREREAEKIRLQAATAQQRIAVNGQTEAERLRLEAQRLAADTDRTLTAGNGHDRTDRPDMTARDRTQPDRAAAMAWLTANGPDGMTGARLAELFGASERTGRRWLEEWLAGQNHQEARGGASAANGESMTNQW